MAQPLDIELEEEFAQKRMTRALFLRLFGYVKPYRRLVALNLVFTVLATVSQLLGPKFIQVGIDNYLTRFSTKEAAIHGIFVISAIYLGNLLLGWGLTSIQVRTTIQVGQGAMNDLRLAVFEHIQKLSLNYFDRTQQGRIISRADTDIDSLDRVVTWGGSQLLSSLLTLIGVFALMLRYDWRLSLAVSLVLPALLFATRLFHLHGLKAYRKVRAHSSRLAAAMAENIQGVRVVQAFAREDENLERFESLHGEYAGHAIAAARVFHTYMPFIGFISGVGTCIILGYGGQLALRGEITVGELAAFVLYLGMFFGPIQTMGDLYNAVLSTAASAERIFQLLDTEPQVRNRPDATALPPLRGAVAFDHVWFRYDSTPANHWVLKDISFEAQPGETVALVGHTGSGKTSVISLLARFYEPHKGQIRVDGVELQSATVESLHQQIGIVTQENFLFTGTVMENLKYGRPHASEDEVKEAARILGTDGMIQRFAEGYQTKVGERGGNLSAGERQLLTITRAMVARPRILILDEATSAVDPQTEEVLQHALEKLFEQRTCFVIAHRLSTVRNAHRILVLDSGAVVESGTHDELLARKGPYARLHDEFLGQSAPR
ncbi:MAG: ABC transporter ATP-binding protein [Verrucomicrobia bacterium]|nr:ABC transporter ATP-binding protein [Verrucomicrobiota bacterium]